MRQCLRLVFTMCAVLLAAGAGVMRPCLAAPAPPAFALHDGDTVVFYGASIVEQRLFGRDIETFTQTRLPRMHVRFINSGWSGDSVSGGGGGPIDLRLTRDVVNYKPTVVTVLLGTNDGGYKPYDEARFQAYARGITHIVDTLTRALPHVRLTLMTPSFFDYGARARPARPATVDGYNFSNPAPDYNQTLVRYGDFVKKLGAERHLTVVDENAPLAAATEAGRRADAGFALSPDGVHPNELGHLIMAAALLTAWHAPLMPSVWLSPGNAKAKVWPLPWPLPAEARAGLRFAPQAARLEAWPAAFSDYNGNPHQPYQILMDGRVISTATALQLAQGINLTQHPNLPQNRQAQRVLALVQQRTDTWHDFWKGSAGLAHPNDIPTDDELSKLRAEDARLDALRTEAHEAAQPVAHMLSVRPLAAAQNQAAPNSQTP